jgi:bifunctional non-homologous end joining protein LigD
MADVFAGVVHRAMLPVWHRQRVPTPRPPLISPMLAALGTLPPAAGWATEFKWDGVRAITYIGGGTVTVMSRNDLDVTSQYPELAALSGLLGDLSVVLDGEIVALDDYGAPDFARLQSRMHVKSPSTALLSSTPVILYLFDILVRDGVSTIGKAYQRRRTLLEQLGLDSDIVRTPPAFLDADPADVYQTAVANRLEGVVCKRLGSRYQPGRRSADWTKVPVARTQEVIIIGWQPGAGRRDGMIGSLLVAAHDPAGQLVYVGKVGTGFTDVMLRDLADDLKPHVTAVSPITGVPRPDARTARWVKPQIVGEVSFRNWTPDNRLRHPSWRGLRPDKSTDQVTLNNQP